MTELKQASDGYQLVRSDSSLQPSIAPANKKGRRRELILVLMNKHSSLSLVEMRIMDSRATCEPPLQETIGTSAGARTHVTPERGARNRGAIFYHIVDQHASRVPSTLAYLVMAWDVPAKEPPQMFVDIFHVDVSLTGRKRFQDSQMFDILNEELRRGNIGHRARQSYIDSGNGYVNCALNVRIVGKAPFHVEVTISDRLETMPIERQALPLPTWFVPQGITCATKMGDHVKSRLNMYARSIEQELARGASEFMTQRVAAITIIENLHQRLRLHRQSSNGDFHYEEKAGAGTVIVPMSGSGFVTLKGNMGTGVVTGCVLYQLSEDKKLNKLSPDALNHTKRFRKQHDYLALSWELGHAEKRFLTVELIHSDYRWTLNDPVDYHIFQILMQLGQVECGELLYRSSRISLSENNQSECDAAVMAHMTVGSIPTISVNLTSSLDYPALKLQATLPHTPLPTLQITLENMHTTLSLEQCQSFLVSCTMQTKDQASKERSLGCGDKMVFQFIPQHERQLGALVFRAQDSSLCMDTPRLVLAWCQSSLPGDSLFFYADMVQQSETEVIPSPTSMKDLYTEFYGTGRRPSYQSSKPEDETKTIPLLDIFNKVYKNGRGMFAQQAAGRFSNGTGYAVTASFKPSQRDNVLNVRVTLTTDFEVRHSVQTSD
jgi:hypothetical protein